MATHPRSIARILSSRIICSSIEAQEMNLLLLVALVGYAYGAWKFWKGFRRTNFSEGKLYLSLLWPVLLISKSYRQNFTKALKG
ncbi:hypothetical protein [Phormidesmis priestleyi]